MYQFALSIRSAVLAIYILSFLAVSRAHTVFTTVFVDGVNQGDGVCIRMNNNGSTSNFFVSPVTSQDMACGIEGEIGGTRVCPAKASSTLTFEFREQPDNVSSRSLDPSHKGPAAVYLKKVDSAIASNNAAGDGWFKIWESIYDEGTSQWGTTKMIANNGHISVQVPADIKGGYYLARTELLALHAADSNPPDPQFYVGCAQLFIESNGTAEPPTVSIGEDTYNLSMPGLSYNIYETPLSLPYPTFGPTVYKAGSSDAASATAPPVASTSAITASTHVTTPLSSSSTSQQDDSNSDSDSDSDDEGSETETKQNEKRANNDSLVQTEGLKPAGCIFVNGNWCGFEVPSYTNQNSCWNSSDACWAQSNDCWNKTQPTGFELCPIFQTKCNTIQTGCQNGDWNGPPNKGADITPEWPALTGSTDIWT